MKKTSKYTVQWQNYMRTRCVLLKMAVSIYSNVFHFKSGTWSALLNSGLLNFIDETPQLLQFLSMQSLKCLLPSSTEHIVSAYNSVIVRTKPGEMIDNLRKVLQFFPGHNFRAKWQTDQLKNIIENLPENECVTVHYFSENYRCTDRVEIRGCFQRNSSLVLNILSPEKIRQYFQHNFCSCIGFDSRRKIQTSALQYIIFQRTIDVLIELKFNLVISNEQKFRSMLRLFIDIL
jgi:hypothetical protein